jgi:hypothetical protein
MITWEFYSHLEVAKPLGSFLKLNGVVIRAASQNRSMIAGLSTFVASITLSNDGKFPALIQYLHFRQFIGRDSVCRWDDGTISNSNSASANFSRLAMTSQYVSPKTVGDVIAIASAFPFICVTIQLNLTKLSVEIAKSLKKVHTRRLAFDMV